MTTLRPPEVEALTPPCQGNHQVVLAAGLYQLREAQAMPYVEHTRLSSYRVPSEPDQNPHPSTL